MITIGERIKFCRQNAGMSQEKVAGLVGVSRQAVTKWESNQSAPNTENLFKLAEIFGTTVDMLLNTNDVSTGSPSAQAYYLYKMEEEKKRADNTRNRKTNITSAIIIAVGYLAIYLIGRFIWCDFSDSSLIGWLISAVPSGNHSYLFGWLLSSRLFWAAMAISSIPSLFGKRRFSFCTLIGFLLGLILGILFGPYPEGAFYGHDHYGWAIWGAIYLLSIITGMILEQFVKGSIRSGIVENKRPKNQ